MKIGIDTFGCDHGKSGFGSYLMSFVANLPSESSNEFELFGSEIDRYTYSSDKEINYISIEIKDNKKVERRFHYSKITGFVKRNKYDVVIYPAAEKILPRKFPVKGIAVVNSILSTYKHQSGDLKKNQVLRRLAKVNLVIASSNFIKEDLIKNGIKADKIKVINTGIDHKLFFQALDTEDNDVVEVKPFAIKKPYFIYASKLVSEDKKHVQLIKAFSMFKEITKLPYRLVLAGDEGSYSHKVKKAAFESEYSSDIFITGYFPHNNFPALYSGAEACIFPAVNEGVGLPVLEAMACGIPVLCSDSGALKEIGEDAPLYFDSDNINDIYEKISQIVNDADLRKEKIAAGIAQSAKFNWVDTVNQTIACAEQLL